MASGLISFVAAKNCTHEFPHTPQRVRLSHPSCTAPRAPLNRLHLNLVCALAGCVLCWWAGEGCGVRTSSYPGALPSRVPSSSIGLRRRSVLMAFSTRLRYSASPCVLELVIPRWSDSMGRTATPTTRVRTAMLSVGCVGVWRLSGWRLHNRSLKRTNIVFCCATMPTGCPQPVGSLWVICAHSLNLASTKVTAAGVQALHRSTTAAPSLHSRRAVGGLKHLSSCPEHMQFM